MNDRETAGASVIDITYRLGNDGEADLPIPASALSGATAPGSSGPKTV